jgi:anti-sigma B factor antagonist
MTTLSFEVRPVGVTHTVVAVAGEVDMATAPQLEDCVLAQGDRDVTVDLSGVGFIDSAGLGALVHVANALRAAGHRFRTTGEQDNVATVMDLVGLTAIFHDDVPVADETGGS